MKYGIFSISTVLLGAGFVLGAPGLVRAHVSVASGPAFANVSQEVVFGVGHGCEGMDTYRVDLEIPAGVTSVRPATSDFGQVDVQTDEAGAVTVVSWQKPDLALLPGDTQFYKLVVRMKLPDAPFSRLFFPAHQTCRAPDGTTTVVDWVAIDASNPELRPAAALTILPKRYPGWNQFTVPSAIDDLGGFFSDAEIVWLGSAAYSANPSTNALIAETEGVTKLESIAAGQAIWVKY